MFDDPYEIDQTDDNIDWTTSSNGLVDLTHKKLTSINPSIFITSKLSLVILDISNNDIMQIPNEISNLLMLREFRASFNLLSSLPSSIGKIKHLRKLILNGNRLESICNEIGQLKFLEELILSENLLETLPMTIGTMSNLKILTLQANDLVNIPLCISQMNSLEEIDCTNNPRLEVIPELWRGHTKSIQTVCDIHTEYQSQMTEVQRINQEIMSQNTFMQYELIRIKESHRIVAGELEELKRVTPRRVLLRLGLRPPGGLSGASGSSVRVYAEESGSNNDSNNNMSPIMNQRISDRCSVS